MKILVDRGSYLCFWNAEGLCPIHIAVQKKNVSVLSLLCSISHVNLRTRNGLTPYMICCQNGSSACASYLLNQGADPFLLSNDLFSCLTLLATAIRQAANRADFALMAKSMATFADQFKLDCFGDLKIISGDVETIQDCAKLAEGMEEEPIPQTSMYDTEGFSFSLSLSRADHYDYPADYSPQQPAYPQEAQEAPKAAPLDLSQQLAPEYYASQTADLSASAQPVQSVEALDPSQPVQPVEAAAQDAGAASDAMQAAQAAQTMQAAQTIQTASVAAAQRRGELEQAVQCVARRGSEA